MIPFAVYVFVGLFLWITLVGLGLHYICDVGEKLQGALCIAFALLVVFAPMGMFKDALIEEVSLVAHLTKDGVPYIEYNGRIVPIGTKIEQNIMDGDKITATRRHHQHVFLMLEKGDWTYVKDSK